MNPMDLKRGIDKSVIAVVEELKKISKACHHQQGNRPGRRNFRQCQTAEIGKIISDAMDKVGKEA